MNIHFFRVFIFEFSLNRPNCRCVCMFMYWLVCVFFFRSVCELKSINGPNVPIVFVYIDIYFVLWFVRFIFHFAHLVSIVRSLFLSVFGPVAMASLNFCAYRVRTSTAKIKLYCCCVCYCHCWCYHLDSRLFSFYLAPKIYLSLSFIMNARHICEFANFFSFFRCCCAIRLPSSCFALLIHWENGV